MASTRKRHDIVELYINDVARGVPSKATLRDYGCDDAALQQRIKADGRHLEQYWQAGEQQEARKRAEQLADACMRDLGDRWEEPELESPRDLAARILGN